jgi:DNA mismatch endonuclease (patch repair protein)
MGSPPAASSAAALQRMRRQQRRDTNPEIALRRELFRRGYRYRVDTPPLPGSRRRADIVFRRARVAVFVDGCFWHGCPQHGTAPAANADWWARKLRQNVERDRDTTARLEEQGWTVVRVWEHVSPTEAADVVALALRPATAGRAADDGD